MRAAWGYVFWRSKAARCTRTLWRVRRWPALLLLAACCWRALAAEAPPEPRPIFAFDIPAQPLQAALEQYSNVTGGSVVYRAALTVGRRSAAVKGIHTPEAALRMLIEGSGLVAEYTATNAVVLQPEPAAPAVARRPANPTGRSIAATTA